MQQKNWSWFNYKPKLDWAIAFFSLGDRKNRTYHPEIVPTTQKIIATAEKVVPTIQKLYLPPKKS